MQLSREWSRSSRPAVAVVQRLRRREEQQVCDKGASYLFVVDENAWFTFCCVVPLTSVFDFLREHIFNFTPLHVAAASGHVDVCQALILAKADLAARDKCDAMPLAVRAHAVRHSRSPLQ